MKKRPANNFSDAAVDGPTFKRRRRVQRIVTERVMFIKNKFGKITPTLVVRDALKKDSPLHRNGGFQWNMRKAAWANWLDRARVLISSVMITVERDNQKRDIGYFCRDPVLPPNVQGYITYPELKDNKELASLAINQQLVVIVGHLHTVLNNAFALGLEDRVRRVIAQVIGLQTAVERKVRHRASKKARARVSGAPSKSRRVSMS